MESGMSATISRFVSIERTVLDVAAANKTMALTRLAAVAAQKINVSTETILVPLLQREALGSTGVGAGVALPHARLRDVATPVGVFARMRRPIAFEAVDELPVDLILLLLLPEDENEASLGALACAARRLRDRSLVERARRARTAGDLHDALTSVA